MKTISQANLVKLLLNPSVSGINGASFIGLDTLTEVKTLLGGKANPMKGKVQKCTIGSSVMVFQNKNVNGYGEMVKRRLEAEGKDVDFKVSPRRWGVRIEGTPLVHHINDEGEENYYLEVIFLSSGKSSYLLSGQPIKKELIQGLPTKKEGTQGGLNNKVIIRSYNINSISRITINKETYIVQ